ERCQYIRVIGGEISRITDHLTCLGMAANEPGAISAGFYMLEAREFLYDLVEAMTGARLTVTYCRLGGVMKDLPADMKDRTAASTSRSPPGRAATTTTASWCAWRRWSRACASSSRP